MVRMYTSAAIIKNSMEVPSKIKTRITIQSSNPTPGNIYRENHNQKDICTTTFIAALFTIAKIWEQPKCPENSPALYATLFFPYSHFSASEEAISSEL